MRYRDCARYEERWVEGADGGCVAVCLCVWFLRMRKWQMSECCVRLLIPAACKLIKNLGISSRLCCHAVLLMRIVVIWITVTQETNCVKIDQITSHLNVLITLISVDENEAQ